jgi:hypothetical protein
MGRRNSSFLRTIEQGKALGLGDEGLDNGDYSVPGKLVQDHSGKMFDGDTSQPCHEQCYCVSSAIPRIAILKSIPKRGVVYDDDGEGTLSVTLYTQNTPDAHVRLAFERDEGTNHFVAAMLDPDRPTESYCSDDPDDIYDNHNFIFWSSVQIREGDILAEIEKFPEPMGLDRSLQQWSRFCLVLRDAGEDYYSIRGHAEIYGNTQWCPGGRYCSDPFDNRPCSSEERESTHLLPCLDASDAVLYDLFGRREDLDGRAEVPGILEFVCYQSEFGNLSFTHSRFSSYVIKIAPDLSSEYDPRHAPVEIQRVPTTENQTMICAHCEGQFDPETLSTKVDREIT